MDLRSPILGDSGWPAWTASGAWPRCTSSINHVFLRAFPGYPVDHAPFWAGWFIYGRFAVVVFIVLSGFSLALSPARHGWRLDGDLPVRAAARPAHPAARTGPRSRSASRWRG